MKAFVFSPSNHNLGKFVIASVESLQSSLEEFCSQNEKVSPYSYVECGNKTWTIMSLIPLTIEEGRIERNFLKEAKEAKEAEQARQEAKEKNSINHFVSIYEKSLVNETLDLTRLSWSDFSEMLNYSRWFLSGSDDFKLEESQNTLFRISQSLMRDPFFSKMLDLSLAASTEAKLDELNQRISDLKPVLSQISKTSHTGAAVAIMGMNSPEN